MTIIENECTCFYCLHNLYYLINYSTGIPGFNSTPGQLPVEKEKKKKKRTTYSKMSLTHY